jgi:hypothetical protein
MVFLQSTVPANVPGVIITFFFNMPLEVTKWVPVVRYLRLYMQQNVDCPAENHNMVKTCCQEKIQQININSDKVELTWDILIIITFSTTGCLTTIHKIYLWKLKSQLSYHIDFWFCVSINIDTVIILFNFWKEHWHFSIDLQMLNLLDIIWKLGIITMFLIADLKK